jgi:chromosome segregation ATPase
MKPAIAILVITAVAIGAVAWHRAHSGSSQVTPPTEAEWTPQRISKDPQGYLAHCDQQIKDQISTREDRIASLASRRVDIESRRQALESNLGDVRNIHDRMQRAMTQADDEDRWPLKMADREFTRDQARAVVDRTQKYLDDRQSLAKSYDDALGQVDQMSATMQKDLDDLKRLREKLALDMEKVQLNQGMAEMGQLHDTEAQIQSMSKTLAGMDSSAGALPPSSVAKDRVDINEMLK